MRWLARHNVTADDGTNPQTGIEAKDISVSRLPPSSDFRIALHSDAGAVISSIDLTRADVHDLRRAISQMMAKPGIPGR